MHMMSSLVANTSAAASATRDTAKAWSSCAQMTTNPTSNTNTTVLRTETTHRRFASIERVGFFEIARTINVRKMRRDSRSNSEVSPSSTTELSMCGNHVSMDHFTRTLITGIERIMGSRHAFFAFPLFQNLLFVKGQRIAVAIQHGLGTIWASLPD